MKNDTVIGNNRLKSTMSTFLGQRCSNKQIRGSGCECGDRTKCINNNNLTFVTISTAKVLSLPGGLGHEGQPELCKAL